MRKLTAFLLALAATALLLAGTQLAITALFVNVVLPRSGGQFPLGTFAAVYACLGWSANSFFRLVRTALTPPVKPKTG